MRRGNLVSAIRVILRYAMLCYAVPHCSVLKYLLRLTSACSLLISDVAIRTVTTTAFDLYRKLVARIEWTKRGEGGWI